MIYPDLQPVPRRPGIKFILTWRGLFVMRPTIIRSGKELWKLSFALLWPLTVKYRVISSVLEIHSDSH